MPTGTKTSRSAEMPAARKITISEERARDTNKVIDEIRMIDVIGIAADMLDQFHRKHQRSHNGDHPQKGEDKAARDVQGDDHGSSAAMAPRGRRFALAAT